MEKIPSFNDLPSEVSDLRKDVNWIKQFLQQKDDLDPQSDQPDKFLTVPEAAQFLGLATQTIYGLICRKEIPCMKRQKRVYFSKAILIKWLEDGRRLTRQEIAENSRPTLMKRGGAK